MADNAGGGDHRRKGVANLVPGENIAYNDAEHKQSSEESFPPGMLLW